ncbi:MAG: HAD-IC family P-type ATPase, partial [Planctomycetia bacterium]
MRREESITPWHTLSLEEIADRLDADLQHGLAAGEADRRRGTYGANLLREPPPEAWWWKFLRQFREVVIWILLVAALIAGAMGDWADTAAILAIVLLNAIIGFLQEERAQQALAALQRISAPVAKVVRDGEPGQLPARELVPGDLIRLEAGDHVPADARLIEAFGLRVQEAALTGESEPVEKQPGEPLPPATPLGDRRSIVHSGTVVAAGRGAAVVVANGMATELGRIASLLVRSPAETTPLQRRLGELGRLLIVVCLVVVAVIFAIELARGGRLNEVLLRAVSLAVA